MTKFMGSLDNQDEELTPSKSQRKRDMQELQKLGKQLVEAPQHILSKIEMEEVLLNAIILARRLPNNKSIRRQLQYIAKLLSQTETHQIKQVLDTYSLQQQNINKAFHNIENWVQRLTHSDHNQALNDLLMEHQNLDRQHLSQLIRNAQKEESLKKPPVSKRKIFAYLRDNINSGDSQSQDL